ncbi:unnamed protein product, partial [Phaeothamnion confervicola]
SFQSAAAAAAATPASAAPAAEASAFAERLSLDNGRDRLVRRLQQVHESLKELSQDDRPAGLGAMARDLASPAVTQHRDKEVRLLAACCLVDVLRVYAPDAPYTPAELRAAFALLLAQLRGLGTAVDPAEPRSRRVHYVLSSLATVKSCVIVVELAQQNAVGSEDLLVELFEALLGGVRPEHPQEVGDAVLEALSACVDEMDVVYQPVLDAVLMCLLPVARAENPRSNQLAQLLLRRCFNRFYQPISQFVNAILTGDGGGGSGGGSGSGGSGAVESDLADHVFPLVYELHKVNPQMLLYVLPNIALQLQAEDVEVSS